MKKIIYLITSLFLFLCFSLNAKAYTNRFILNYDSFQDLLDSDSKYSDIISGIQNRLSSTNYRYYIYIYNSNSPYCPSSTLYTNYSDYNQYCTINSVNNNGGFRISLVIYNPDYYNSDDTVQHVYFAISGGYYGSFGALGPVTSFNDNYSSDSIVLRKSSHTVTYSNFRYGTSFGSVSDLSNLDTWLSNPTFNDSVDTSGNWFSIGYGSGFSGSAYQYGYMPYFIYSNFSMINKYVVIDSYYADRNPYQYYRNNELNTSVVNESSDNQFIYTREQVLPPVVSNLGNDSYQISSNQIIIRHSTALDTINCPTNTDFLDNFCYTNFHNYSNISDISSSNIFINFDFGSGSNIPYLSDNYYAFTFRVDSNIDLDITNIIIYSGNLYNGRTPVNINKYAYGLYTDYQVIFQAPTDSNLSVTGVAIRLNSINGSDLSDFSFGVYNKYTYKQFGTTEPSLSEQNTYYNNNSLDTIDNNKSSWFTGFNINTRGLTSIVTAPFRYFRYIINSNGVCSSFTLPTYYFGNIQMPCIQSIIYSKIPDIVILYRVIMSGLICYYVIAGYLKLAMICFNPTDSRIEVVDL